MVPLARVRDRGCVVSHAAIGLSVLALALLGLARAVVLVARLARRIAHAIAVAWRSSRRAGALRKQRHERDAILARLACQAEAGVIRNRGGVL